MNYTESELVSFGNYLLEKCKVKGYSVDGEPCFNRMVMDADLCNWKEINPRKCFKTSDILPSQFTIGSEVKVFLMPEGEESFPGFNAKVTAVHFTNSKVKYDLEIEFYGNYISRIYNVDSVLVTKR